MPDQRTLKDDNSQEPSPVFLKKETEKDLLTWTAAARPFKRRNREFFITVGAMAGVVGLVLFIIEGVLPLILLISLLFLFYVMSTVEPANIEYKITNFGIKVAGKRTDWNAMKRFWFVKRMDSELLIIETFSLPGRLEMVIRPEIKKDIEKIISDYIPFEEQPASYIDKATTWVSGRVPGNK